MLPSSSNSVPLIAFVLIINPFAYTIVPSSSSVVESLIISLSVEFTNNIAWFALALLQDIFIESAPVSISCFKIIFVAILIFVPLVIESVEYFVCVPSNSTFNIWFPAEFSSIV